jgi:hypothetical protein
MCLYLDERSVRRLGDRVTMERDVGDPTTAIGALVASLTSHTPDREEVVAVFIRIRELDLSRGHTLSEAGASAQRFTAV